MTHITSTICLHPGRSIEYRLLTSDASISIRYQYRYDTNIDTILAKYGDIGTIFSK